MHLAFRKNFRETACAAVLSATLVFGSAGGAIAGGEYLPGDFHQHTLYTDGSYPFMQVIA